MGWPKVTIQFNSPLKHVFGVFDLILIKLPQMPKTTLCAFPCVEVLWGATTGSLSLEGIQLRLYRAGDRLRDFIL